ncbi:MAG: helix-turn-helix domain-containing protein [Myxococcota bacterium]
MSASFGEIIYRRRKALNMTQEVLADKVGVKPTYIGYLERSKRHPSPRIAGLLADVLGLNRSYLFLASNPVVRDFLNINDQDHTVEGEVLPGTLDALIQDQEVRAAHNISDEDIQLLKRMAFLGDPTHKMDYVLILQVIRKCFGPVA